MSLIEMIYPFLEKNAHLIYGLVCREWAQHLDLMKYEKVTSYSILSIVSLIEWCRPAYTVNLLETLAKCGFVKSLRWAHANGKPWNRRRELIPYVESMQIEVVWWAHENGYSGEKFTLFGYTSDNWASEMGCLDENTICAYAARNGSLSILQWARANGYPWNEDTCSYAALNGHLEVLQWARANGCPWDTRTCASAAERGHFEVLVWARANGCPWGIMTCIGAAEWKDRDMLIWLQANECPCRYAFHFTYYT